MKFLKYVYSLSKKEHFNNIDNEYNNVLFLYYFSKYCNTEASITAEEKLDKIINDINGIDVSTNSKILLLKFGHLLNMLEIGGFIETLNDEEIELINALQYEELLNKLNRNNYTLKSGALSNGLYFLQRLLITKNKDPIEQYIKISIIYVYRYLGKQKNESVIRYATDILQYLLEIRKINKYIPIIEPLINQLSEILINNSNYQGNLIGYLLWKIDNNPLNRTKKIEQSNSFNIKSAVTFYINYLLLNIINSSSKSNVKNYFCNIEESLISSNIQGVLSNNDILIIGLIKISIDFSDTQLQDYLIRNYS